MTEDPPTPRLRRGQQRTEVERKKLEVEARNEGAALFFLHCAATVSSADDRAARKLFSQSHFDLARLDTGNNSRVSGGE